MTLVEIFDGYDIDRYVEDGALGGDGDASLIDMNQSLISVQLSGGITITLHGRFRYTADGTLSGGTWTGLSALSPSGVAIGRITGMWMDLRTVAAYARRGDSAGLVRAVMAGPDTLIGNSAANALHGYAGNDTLQGGVGQDIIAGGAGADVLSGGAGADRFRYARRNEGGDRITDFASRQDDRLEFSASAFGYLGRGALHPSRFQSLHTSSRATNAQVRFIFNRRERALYFDADGSGRQAAVRIATFSTPVVMTAGQIVIA